MFVTVHMCVRVSACAGNGIFVCETDISDVFYVAGLVKKSATRLWINECYNVFSKSGGRSERRRKRCGL